MQANFKNLPDHQLLSAAQNMVAMERRLQCQQIEVFAEIARRRLHLKAGFDSLFTYLVKELGFSKACAYQRSVIAKASQQWPDLLTMIEDKRLTLTTAALLTKHLNLKNGAELLRLASGKSKEELEILMARRTNTPVVRDSVRPIAVRGEETRPAASTVVDASRGAASEHTGDVGPNTDVLGAETGTAKNPTSPRAEDIIVKVSFATNKRVSDKLGRVKDLLARKLPQALCPMCLRLCSTTIFSVTIPR